MPPKPDTVRLLVLHESQDNAEQIINTLKNKGIATRPELVGSEDEMLEALKNGAWDIMLAGEVTNGVPYENALLQIRKQDKDIPLIVLLDKFDQEIVDEAMKGGAADAVVFNALPHLSTVILRELDNLQHRRARRKAEAALAEAEKRNRLLLDNSRDAIAYVHDGMHIYANSAYAELFGHESTEDVEGMPVIDLVAKEDLSRFKDFLRAYGKGEGASEDLRFHGIKADGDKIDAMMQLSAASYDGEPCTQIIIRRDDGAGNAAMLAEKLKEATSMDPLTGLPNRQRFEEDVSAAVYKARKDKSRHALFCIAIDNLPQISATHGLSGTDTVVKTLASMLVTQFGNASVARFNDSSFTALVAGMEPEKAQAHAEQICQQIHDHLFQIPGGKTQQTTVSVGVAMIGETAPEPDEMLSRVVGASEKVKLAKGNGVHVFNAAEQAGSSDSAMLELLVDAVDNSKFKLFYQPLVDVEGGHGEFYEVFVRLPLPDGKLLTPDEFMPVAHKHQLGVRVDRWVMLNAAKQLKEHTRNHPNSRMLLNLTAESLQDVSLPAWISKLSKAIDPQGSPMVLQFTEGDMVAYLKAASQQTEELTKAGCPVSISHFGTSLNPMNTLKHVAASYVKLDRSFTQDLSNEEGMGQIRKITGELRGFDKQVIISYVENAQTLSKLWTLGVQYLQGFFLQPPGETMHYESQS
ncbi:MAG TPA: EAL domain-containing protein [Moraxellaceae bacterium]|nr:EAL domain-containing protein [Moraxellaceae bacterium]